MKAKQKKDLDVDFIQSKPLNPKEAKELSEFIKEIKQKAKKKKAA